jgi:hypothetical protein
MWENYTGHDDKEGFAECELFLNFQTLSELKLSFAMFFVFFNFFFKYCEAP